MKRCKWMVVLVLGAALCGACGGADDASASDKGGSSGSAGSNGSSGAIGLSGSAGAMDQAGAGGSAADLPVGAVGCGGDMCVPPENSTSVACCADPFADPPVCGTMLGQSCTPLPHVDERCPSVMSMMGTVFLPSCCTDDGQCGIDASVFGMPGCTENSEAQMGAGEMAAGQFITIPDAQSCN